MAGKHLDAMPPMTNVQPSAITSCDWKDNVKKYHVDDYKRLPIPRDDQKLPCPNCKTHTILECCKCLHCWCFLLWISLYGHIFFWLSSLYQYCKLARPSQFRCIFFLQSSVGLNFCGLGGIGELKLLQQKQKNIILLPKCQHPSFY